MTSRRFTPRRSPHSAFQIGPTSGRIDARVDSAADGLARLGLALRLLRERAEMTQESLAARAGKSTQYISDLERGRRHPTYRTLVDVLTALQASLTSLDRALRQV